MGFRSRISQWGQFWVGVFAAIVEWAIRLWRWLGFEEKQFEHFFRRLFTVEKRIDSPVKRFAFLYRWLRYVIHHYHLIPNWAKALKIIVIILMIFSQPIKQMWNESYRETALYKRYYEEYYAYYRKTLPHEKADYYANHYATQYAEYYTSAEYQDALRYALPEPAKASKIMQEAERVAIPELRELALPPIGMEMIKHFEGLELEPYLDQGGKYTIGYGHLMRPGERYTKITEQKATQLLRKDVEIAEALVKQQVRVPLGKYQYAALVSLVYNIGGYQFEKSTLLKRLNIRDYRGAAEEISRWNKVGRFTSRGLTRRRKMEQNLFTGAWQKEQKRAGVAIPARLG